MPICWPPIPPMPMPMPPIPIPPIPMPIPPMPPMPPPLPPPLPPPIPMPPMPPYIPPMPYPPWPPMPMPPIPGGPDVQRLAADHLQVHLRDSLRRLLRGGEAHEAEALGRALLIADNLGRRDLAEGAEVLAELLVVDALVEVLDVEVHALLRAGRGALRVELALQAVRALGLGLRALHVHLLARLVGILALGLLLLLVRALVRLVVLVHGLLRGVGGLEVHEREGALLLVRAPHRGGDGAAAAEDLLELVLVPALRHVLHVQVREDLHLVVAVPHLDELADLHRLLADLHAVHALDGLLRRVLGLEVHEPVALRLAVLVGRDLAGQDVAEQAERVVQGLVVDVRVEVLHEDVPRAGLAHRRVAVAPHDAAGAALDLRVVQGVQRALRVGDVVVVHVGVPERLASDGVTAHTDRGHRAHGVEDLVQDRLRDILVDITDVERGELLHAGAAARAAAARSCHGGGLGKSSEDALEPK